MSHTKSIRRFAIATRNSGLALLRRFHLVGLCGLGRIVISPEPDHLFGKFGRALAGVVRAFAETEMKVVVLQLQRVGQANIGQRPASVAVILLVLGAVLQPYAKIAPGTRAKLFRDSPGLRPEPQDLPSTGCW